MFGGKALGMAFEEEAAFREMLRMATRLDLPVVIHCRDAELDLLPMLRDVCDEHGIRLVLDEIQSGMGRTGRWFAVEHTGVVPDLMTIAKGLTAGYLPLAATLTTEIVHRAFRGRPEEGRPSASFLNQGSIHEGHLVGEQEHLGILLPRVEGLLLASRGTSELGTGIPNGARTITTRAASHGHPTVHC